MEEDKMKEDRCTRWWTIRWRRINDAQDGRGQDEG
jgi:hypothetical protein